MCFPPTFISGESNCGGDTVTFSISLTAQADYTLHNDAGLGALQAAAARLCERLQAEGGVTAAL